MTKLFTLPSAVRHPGWAIAAAIVGTLLLMLVVWWLPVHPRVRYTDPENHFEAWKWWTSIGGLSVLAAYIVSTKAPSAVFLMFLVWTGAWFYDFISFGVGGELDGLGFVLASVMSGFIATAAYLMRDRLLAGVRHGRRR